MTGGPYSLGVRDLPLSAELDGLPDAGTFVLSAEGTRLDDFP